MLVDLAYHLDHPYVVARSAETCLGSARYRSFVEGRLREAPRTERPRGDTLLRALQDSREELAQAGLEPLRCDEPEVQAVVRCVVQAGVTGPVGPHCHAPELRAALVRLHRG